MNKSVSIITDLDGAKIALINDIRFKSRKGINWNEIEQYLKEYIGEYFEIAETSEKIYIGSDFPDEFSHSNDTKGLKGANMKAKANITSAIGELIQIASDKSEYRITVINMVLKQNLAGIAIIQDLGYLFMMRRAIWNDITFLERECL